MRNILGLGVIFCVLVRGATPCLSADPTEMLLHKNRELVAKDYETPEGQLTTARIALRKPVQPRTWWSVLFGEPSSSPAQTEVVAFLKSGEELLIDRLETKPLIISSAGIDDSTARASSVIIDGAGSVIGYFRFWVTEEGHLSSHRLGIALYFIVGRSVVRSVVEVQCSKSKAEGRPHLQVDNARWDGELRELEFTLRSGCYHVNLFNDTASRTFNMALGKLTYETAYSKSFPSTEEGQRMAVRFDERGVVISVDKAKGDVANRKSFQKCSAEARKDNSFRTCEVDTFTGAHWKFEGARVSHPFSCGEYHATGPSAVGKNYIVISCSAKKPEEESKWVSFELATEQMREPVEFVIRCACKELSIERLSLNPEHRTLSFNLITDAKTLTFVGGEFQVPTISSRVVDGKTVMAVSVFNVRLNDQWQIVEMTASGVESSRAQGAGN